MDKNCIEGRQGAMRGHKQATNRSAVALYPSSGMPVEVNAAAVQWSNVSLPGEIHSEQSERKSAEVIVVEETSRGQHARLTNDTGEIASVPLRLCYFAFSSSGK